MKKIALSILSLVKESYKISMKRIRYELSLDYENEIEDVVNAGYGECKKGIGIKGKLTIKQRSF